MFNRKKERKNKKIKNKISTHSHHKPKIKYKRIIYETIKEQIKHLRQQKSNARAALP